MANDREVTSTPAPVQADAGLGVGGLDIFLRLLLESTDPESLATLTAQALASEGQAAFAFLVRRTPGTHRVAARDSALFPGGTVLEIVNDDRPFLLDSVMGEVTARGLEARLVLHPIFKAARDAAGQLAAVTAAGDRHWGDGRQESYIAIHLGPMSALRREELAAAVSSILEEVRIAVVDWRPMLGRLARAASDLERAAPALPSGAASEALAFLDWLGQGSFTFLGMREYRLDGTPEEGELVSEESAGLGLLRDPAVRVLRRGNELVTLTPEIRQFFFSPDPVIITKANVVSRVHRRVHMDYIGVKLYRPDGMVAGELRIVGLFTATAYTQSPGTIPILRQKVAQIADRLALPPESHAGKTLANVLETFPRDELFQIGMDDLERWASGMLDLELRPRTRVFLRYDRFDRFVSALVFMPRDRFSTSLRLSVGEMLAERFGGYIAAFYPHFREGPLVRVHFIVARRTGRIPAIAPAELETAIAGLLRTWSDGLADAIAARAPDAAAMLARYQTAFPAGYAEVFPPARAIEDIARIERLGPERKIGIDFHREEGMAAAAVRAAIYSLDEPIRLSERVPLLENLGFSVVDERTWRLAPRLDGRPRTVILHDMVLATFDGRPYALGSDDDRRLEDAFVAATGGATESDGFNRLVLVARLAWREAAILRAYASYLRQLGSAFGPRYIAETLVANQAIAADLWQLFRARFEPREGIGTEDRQAMIAEAASRIEAALAGVGSLDEDRILRLIKSLIEATVRTNYFRRGGDGTPPATIAFKLDGRSLAMAPAPRPYREIFLTSPRVEGVHLRFAPIARGGIRWSDRAQDYRTEVLGLAKAQHVKNAVIVPAGAKGGFLPKALPRTGGREEIQAEGLAAYRIFVGGLLELTDNIVDGQVVPPDDVVRHDGDDPYLVVAADKGTATFSDAANAIAAERAFWLGDAFASGGSAGYDHKGLGITARGAWECVKRHFRELDRDIQSEPFRVIGVGDMSGDVFGNGMLLSPSIRLLAAFDHRDIFLDPAPDPAVSLAERRRLFAKPRSSWADYDRARLSAGGGVFSRQLKSIPLSPEVKAMLGVASDTLTPSDLMRAILRAETDLLWFGGIGTYVRASSETDADVGDRANDTVRVAARELRAKVIGEGANLGLTQRGRIEAAEQGIRLNTDFIDNSAGVNTSDQEVNIKIALGPAVRAGRLELAQRNRLLSEMSADVAAAVLRNNHQQSLALSLAERRGARDMGSLARLMRHLEARGIVDRQLEALPGEQELAERARRGSGLTRPELAIVLSYAKIAILHDLLASAVPDDPSLNGLLLDYFPAPLRERFRDEILAHRLRREIVATTLTNGLVNRLGPAGALALADAAARPVADVAVAFMTARGGLDLARLWQRLDALDGRIKGVLQLDLYERVRASLVATAAALLRETAAERPLDVAIDRLRASAAAIAGELASDTAKPSPIGQAPVADARDPASLGVEESLLADLGRLPPLASAPSVAGAAEASGASLAEAAAAHLAVASALGIDRTLAAASQLAPADDYERRAIAAAVAGLGDAHRRLTVARLAAKGAAGADTAAWLEALASSRPQARQDLAQIAGERETSLARLAVAGASLASLADTAELAARP